MEAQLPQPILDRLQVLSGNTSEEVIHGFMAAPVVSLRVNRLKGLLVNGTPVPWCDTGYYLDKRPAFALDPFFHVGAYYVQEAASMFLEQYVKQCGIDKHPIAALDLCAAPGGKSTHLRSLLHEDSLLVCNEVDAERRNVLEEVIWKWGHPNVCVSQARSETIASAGEGFNLIIVDAPCSGSGMMRKDAFAIEQWSEQLEVECALGQKKILDAAWSMLEPDGMLIYSTCAFSSEENEEQVDRLVEEFGASIVQLPESEFPGVIMTDQGYYFLPHRTRSEGLFITALRKQGDASSRKALSSPSAAARSTIPWAQLEGQTIIENDGTLFTVNEQWQEKVKALNEALRYFKPGIPVAEQGKNGPVPHPAIALSALVARDIPIVEMDTVEALEVIRGNVLRRDVGKGYALGTYRGIPFVWLKGAGNRWNSSWPKAWRLRSQRV